METLVPWGGSGANGQVGEEQRALARCAGPSAVVSGACTALALERPSISTSFSTVT